MCVAVVSVASLGSAGVAEAPVVVPVSQATLPPVPQIAQQEPPPVCARVSGHRVLYCLLNSRAVLLEIPRNV